MRRLEIVFIPTPAIGHLIPAVEFCKLLVERNDQLSITILLMKQSFDPKLTHYCNSIAASLPSAHGIKFIDLPDVAAPAANKTFFISMIESNKSHVKAAVSQLMAGAEPPRKLAGFVVDILCTCMMEVANEFGVPSYIFSTSGAAYLGLLLHVQDLHDNQGVDSVEFKDSGAELALPGLVNPLPAKVLPSPLFDKDWLPIILDMARKFRASKGLIINTFLGLESHAITTFNENKTKMSPPVYPVGPILNLKGGSDDHIKEEEIMEWLDHQPPSSVVFLCFGSTGSFSVDQVKEIASALECCGHRFLWSLRQSRYKAGGLPVDFSDLRDVSPDGFLDRTVGHGK
ncbi:hypothetical protein Tsubulata_050766, partial [Turnera subulata]